jgi:hypothetical protein
MKKTKILLILLLIITLGIVQRSPGRAQTTLNQVGLVVQFGDGRIETECIQFEEESITGYEVFERSSFNYTPDFNAGNGWAICKIEEDGCAANDCFCYPTLYWSYWLLTDGAWLYSPLGSSNFDVYDGDVQGWRWGEGGEPDQIYTMEEICVPPTPTPTHTATATKTNPPPTATSTQVPDVQAIFPTDTSASSGGASPTNTPRPNPTNTPRPTATATQVPSTTPPQTGTTPPSATPLATGTSTMTSTVDVAMVVEETQAPTLEASPTEASGSAKAQAAAPATEKKNSKDAQPTEDRQGFQKSDAPAVVLLGGTATPTPVLESSEAGAGLKVSKMALLTGGILGYLVFIVLIGGLGIGLVALLIVRRK